MGVLSSITGDTVVKDFAVDLRFSMTTEIASEGVDINIVALMSQLW